MAMPVRKGAPGWDTWGHINEIYTDEETGISYKLVGVYDYTTKNSFIKTLYDWRRITTQSSGGGIKTAIIKDSVYDELMLYMNGESTENPDMSSVTYSCINMTHEEANKILNSGEPLGVLFMLAGEGCMLIEGFASYIGGTDHLIILACPNGGSSGLYVMLYWTPDGIIKG